MSATDISGPDVSCIVAAYECSDTIGGAIESALAQTGVTVEIVIVDDASPGGVAPAAVEWAEREPERVRLLQRPANGGPGAARNDAIAAARGTWLAILDADDAMRPDRLSTTLANAGDADILIDNPLVAHPDDAGSSRPLPMFEPDAWSGKDAVDLADFVRGNTLFDDAFNYGYVKPVLRTAFVRRLGLRYDEAPRIGEDFLFLADALAGGARCRAIATSGYVYNVRQGSISRVLRAEHIAAMRAGDERFLARHPDLDARARAAFARREASFDRAEAFLALVDTLKARRPVAAALQALRRPDAAALLRLPLAARLRRVKDGLRARLPSRRRSENGRSARQMEPTA